MCLNGTILPPDESPSEKAPPTVDINGHSKDVDADRDVVFRCTVVSSLAANITWFHDKVPLMEKVDNRHSLLECKTVLQIKGVLTEDAGNYTCAVQNELGRATASSRLSVNQKDKGPYILYLGLENKIGSHVAVIGSNVNLTCESQNTRVQNYFTKNGSVVQEGDGKHYTLYYMPDHMRNVKVANLEIKNVTLEDAGNYTCFAWLDGIRKNSTFSLSVVYSSCNSPGYFCPPGSQLPNLCSPGYYCPPGSKSPVSCPWGTYQPLAGVAAKNECKPCENVNTSKKPDHYTPAVNITDCPPAEGPESELEKDEKSSQSSQVTPAEIFAIVFGIIGAIILTVLALYCVAKRAQWLSPYKTRTTSTSRRDLESSPSELIMTQNELNGACGNTAQYSEVVKRPPEVDYEAKYDVFICYSSKDISWVKELLAELEKRRFACCIDFKDFVPGAAIVENISQAIYYSRKTIAVLTPDFVASEWCSHELQKALTRIRSHQVLPIVYKSCTIPLVLQDRTYLDWENCHVKPYFWDQLERALKLPNDGEICFDKFDTTRPLIS